MIRRLPWLLIAIVAVSLVYGWFAMRPAGNSGAIERASNSSGQRQRSDADPSAPALKDDAVADIEDALPVANATTAGTSKLDDVASRAQLGTDSVDNLLAHPTGPEAAWMRRNGYPSYEEWMRRNEIPLAELELRAGRGDVVAQIMLADRLHLTEPNRAEQLLEKALSTGSAFAAGVLADQLSARALAETDPRLVSLYRDQIFRLGQIAALLGDYRVSEQIVLRNVQIPVDGYTLSRAMYGAHLFLSETNAQRQRTGLPPLQPSIRPGFDAWNLLLHGPRPETISIDCSARPDLCVPVSRKQ